MFGKLKAPKDYEEFTSITMAESNIYCMNSINQPIRKYIADKISLSQTVLEVGCGNGIDAHLYSPGQYTGIDVSPKLIHTAMVNNPAHHFLWLEAKSFLEQREKYDVIICKAVLEHQSNVAQTLDLFKLMVAKSSILYLAWHMKPTPTKTEIRVVRGHFGKSVYQNHYDSRLFDYLPDISIEKEHVDNYELWTVKNE